MARRLTNRWSGPTRQSSNFHTQICRLSGSRLMLAVRRHWQCPRRIGSRSVLEFVESAACPKRVSVVCVLTRRTAAPSTAWKPRVPALRTGALFQHRSRFGSQRMVLERLSLLHQNANRRIVPMSLVAIAGGIPRVHSQAHTTAFCRVVAEPSKVPSNNRMQPTHQTRIKFACANLPPVWRAADAWC